MGTIRITTSGSFGDTEKVFSAQEGGHAYAISRAQGVLMHLLGKSIRLDHKLHKDGSYPELSDFGEKAPKA